MGYTEPLAQRIDELPDERDVDCTPETGRAIQFSDTDELKRLIALLRRCEPVVRSMSNATGIVGDESHKLLGEIREVMG